MFSSLVNNEVFFYVLCQASSTYINKVVFQLTRTKCSNVVYYLFMVHFCRIYQKTIITESAKNTVCILIFVY